MDYSRFNFPAYEFRPYPKWVKHPDGTSSVVQSEDEEIALLDRLLAEADKADAAKAKVELAATEKANDLGQNTLKLPVKA